MLGNRTYIIVYILMLSRLSCVKWNACLWTSLRVVVLKEKDGVVLGVSWSSSFRSLHTSNEHLQLYLPHLCSRYDEMSVVGNLEAYGCPLCGLGDHWCSSTHLHYLNPEDTNTIHLNIIGMYDLEALWLLMAMEPSLCSGICKAVCAVKGLCCTLQRIDAKFYSN